MKITKCPISGSDKSIEYLNLGLIPLVNNLCETKKESLECERFPLAVQLFPESKLTCLTDIIDKEKLFFHYLYRSGVNKPYLKHCIGMYQYLSKYLHLTLNAGDIVADIGGNDGSLLLEFKKLNPGPEYVNVDCSESFMDLNKSLGITYMCQYFNERTQLPRKAKLITSTNVFQHTEPIRSFVKGIYNNLSEGGMWCLEFPYFLTTMASDNYDQIYHEHVYYYLLSNIVDLLDQEGLKVINVSYHDMHAGTLRVISVRKTSMREPDGTVLSFMNMENLITKEYCVKWGMHIQQKIEELQLFIANLIFEGHTIAGFGAAAKGCIFLNTCNIDHTMMKFIIDDTEFKQGKFIPGTGIQVVGRSVLKKNRVDYILILAHNFKDYIINSLKGEYDGKFIVMFPEIEVI